MSLFWMGWVMPWNIFLHMRLVMHCWHEVLHELYSVKQDYAMPQLALFITFSLPCNPLPCNPRAEIPFSAHGHLFCKWLKLFFKSFFGFDIHICCTNLFVFLWGTLSTSILTKKGAGRSNYILGNRYIYGHVHWSLRILVNISVTLWNYLNPWWLG